MIVVDASVLLDILLPTPGIDRVGSRLFSDDSWHAPHLVDLEVAQVLRRWVLAGKIGGERGWRALRDLGDLPLTRYPHTLFLPRIWRLRFQVTAYDAAYLALAEALNAPLVTRDARLGAAHGHRASVEVL